MNLKDKNRIVFVGAGGVGKTTLLNEFFHIVSKNGLAEKWTKIPEVAKEVCRQQGYKTIYEIEDHHKFRKEVLDKQVELEDKHGAFVSDRSTIDCWVHFQRWSIIKATVEDAEAYYQKSKEQAEKYDQIIFVPKTFETPDDGFRWANDVYQTQIERLIKNTLYEWGLWDKTYTVKSVSKDDRVTELLKGF